MMGIMYSVFMAAILVFQNNWKCLNKRKDLFTKDGLGLEIIINLYFYLILVVFNDVQK